MKKRLSILLIIALAMTMVMGMSIMAYADEWQPLTIDCGTSDHQNFEHFYVVSTDTFPSDYGQCVSGWKLIPDSGNPGQSTVTDWRAGSGNYMSRDYFPGNLEMGWYYRTGDDSNFHKCPPPVVEAEPSSAAHTHDYHWQTIVLPTKDQDGLESEVCVCGATRNIQRLPALGFTLNEYATPMVVNAQPGQTVELELGELNSFPKSFMEKVAVKTQQNVSFGFHYNWEHVGQEIKIPAGTVVDTNFDWYGPAKMEELYGSLEQDRLNLSPPEAVQIRN